MWAYAARRGVDNEIENEEQGPADAEQLAVERAEGRHPTALGLAFGAVAGVAGFRLIGGSGRVAAAIAGSAMVAAALHDQREAVSVLVGCMRRAVLTNRNVVLAAAERARLSICNSYHHRKKAGLTLSRFVSSALICKSGCPDTAALADFVAEKQAEGYVWGRPRGTALELASAPPPPGGGDPGAGAVSAAAVPQGRLLPGHAFQRPRLFNWSLRMRDGWEDEERAAGAKATFISVGTTGESDVAYTTGQTFWVRLRNRLFGRSQCTYHRASNKMFKRMRVLRELREEMIFKGVEHKRVRDKLNLAAAEELAKRVVADAEEKGVVLAYERRWFKQALVETYFIGDDDDEFWTRMAAAPAPLRA